jgi:hypothetical protein
MCVGKSFDRGLEDPTSTTKAGPLLCIRAAEMSRIIGLCFFIEVGFLYFSFVVSQDCFTQTDQNQEPQGDPDRLWVTQWHQLGGGGCWWSLSCFDAALTLRSRLSSVC